MRDILGTCVCLCFRSTRIGFGLGALKQQPMDGCRDEMIQSSPHPTERARRRRPAGRFAVPQPGHAHRRRQHWVLWKQSARRLASASLGVWVCGRIDDPHPSSNRIRCGRFAARRRRRRTRPQPPPFCCRHVGTCAGAKSARAASMRPPNDGPKPRHGRVDRLADARCPSHHTFPTGRRGSRRRRGIDIEQEGERAACLSERAGGRLGSSVVGGRSVRGCGI